MNASPRSASHRPPPRLILLAAFWLVAAPATAADESRSPEPRPLPGASLPTGSPGAASPGDAASAASAQTPMQVIAQPKLEVQRGSGDFTSFHDSIVSDGTVPVRLRWSPVLSGAAKARWRTRATPSGPPAGPRNAPSGAIPTAPEPGKWHYFDVTLFTQRRGSPPPGATRYLLELIALNAQGEAMGQPSKPVVIDYQPPGSGPPQQIQLDSVQLLDWSPKSGLMNGPSDGDYWAYGPDQKVDVTFRIELVTEDNARLINHLIGPGGSSLHGNFYTFVDVSSKGVHNEQNFVTIRCDEGIGNAYYEQTATGLKWELIRKGTDVVLSEGSKTFSSPLTWHCPDNDQLILSGMNPAAGKIQGIGSPADASKPGRSVQLHYQYRLGSRPKAVVKQVPLQAGGQPVPHEYWTTTTVSNGVGSATNRLSVYCQSELQPDVEVKLLRYTLAEEGTGERILQEVVPVDWRFSCKPSQILPSALKQAPILRPSGSRGRAAPAETDLQKARPAAAPTRERVPAVRPGAAPAQPGVQKVPGSAPRPALKPAAKPLAPAPARR